MTTKQAPSNHTATTRRTTRTRNRNRDASMNEIEGLITAPSPAPLPPTIGGFDVHDVSLVSVSSSSTLSSSVTPTVITKPSNDDEDDDDDEDDNGDGDEEVDREERSPIALLSPNESLREIDALLTVGRNKLEEFEIAQRFVAVRITSNRKSLQHRAQMIKQLGNQDTTITSCDDGHHHWRKTVIHHKQKNSNNNKANTLIQKYSRDEKSLAKVIETHKSMLLNVEAMRQRIVTLERKRKEILQRTQKNKPSSSSNDFGSTNKN